MIKLHHRAAHPIVAALALLFALAPLPAGAADTASADGTIKIRASWTRATPNGARVAGGFLTITNTGPRPDRLIGGTFANAGRVEVHEMAVANGMMTMRQLEAGLTIEPGATVELKPGGFHLMFMDLKSPVKENDQIGGTLIFEHAGTVAIEYRATSIGATPKPPVN